MNKAPKNKKLNIMINFSEVTGQNTQEHNSYLPQIPDHSCRILVAGDSGLGKTNPLPNLRKHQLDVDKIYLYAKDWHEAKY